MKNKDRINRERKAQGFVCEDCDCELEHWHDTRNAVLCEECRNKRIDDGLIVCDWCEFDNWIRKDEAIEVWIDHEQYFLFQHCEVNQACCFDNWTPSYDNAASGFCDDYDDCRGCEYLDFCDGNEDDDLTLILIKKHGPTDPYELKAAIDEFCNPSR